MSIRKLTLTGFCCPLLHAFMAGGSLKTELTPAQRFGKWAVLEQTFNYTRLLELCNLNQAVLPQIGRTQGLIWRHAVLRRGVQLWVKEVLIPEEQHQLKAPLHKRTFFKLIIFTAISAINDVNLMISCNCVLSGDQFQRDSRFYREQSLEDFNHKCVQTSGTTFLARHLILA